MKMLIKKITTCWFIHLLIVWFVTVSYVVISYVYEVSLHGNYHFNQDGSPVSAWQYFLNHTFRYDMLVLAFALLLAEINYQILFKMLKWALFILSCLIFAFVAFVILALGHPRTIEVFGLLSGAGPILFMALYALVYALVRDYFYQYNRKKDLDLQHSQNELDALKAQLNPHFLFNSLNYLYGTALKENAMQTADGVDKLSDLLRYTVNGMQHNEVALTDEIHFIKNYLSLQKARIPQKKSIKVSVEINVAEEGFKIAPLLLLTFIENAFKHGISMDEECFVDLCIHVKNGWLNLQIVNSIVKTSSQLKHSNTGLATTQKRLELLYPDNYSLKLDDNHTSYSASLKIKLNI
ncbi:sensor histidine kinase [Mucilaginibacter litoreus]|uniref:Sensor histidine kinase n=1 Tax=Mucilaginibacter litoreus TaxID=1048221 RepID=A0ABW3ASC7_9SPHI